MFANKEEKKEAEKISNSSNNIGKGTMLTGDLETHGNIGIEGKVVGNVKSKSKVAIGESSVIEGNIIAANAIVAGEVSGKIEISDLLTLKPTAIIHGDIITNKLVVESGAKFNGACKMGVKMQEIRIGENGQTTRNQQNRPKQQPQNLKTV